MRGDDLLAQRGGQPEVHEEVRELVREDVPPGVARVGVEVEEVLLASRGLQPAHAARPLVKAHPLLARVAAVDALHVPVLRQVGRALVLADDVHTAMPATPRSAAVGRRGGSGARRMGGAEMGEAAVSRAWGRRGGAD